MTGRDISGMVLAAYLIGFVVALIISAVVVIYRKNDPESGQDDPILDGVIGGLIAMMWPIALLVGACYLVANSIVKKVKDK